MEKQILDEIVNVKKKIEKLNAEFEEKNKSEEWMQTKYDEMHKRMLMYQNGIVEKTLDPLLKAIILLSDSIRKDISILEEEHPEEKTVDCLYGLIEQIDAILFEYDVEKFNGPKTFDPKLQTVFKTMATDDPTKNQQVISCVTVGYKRNDRVFRPEKVIIYKK